ncbi:MAG: ATP-binding protein [Pirellulales bacterium]
MANRISQQTHNQLTVFDLPNIDGLRATELAGIVEACERSGSELSIISQESMVIHKTMHDVYGRPAVLLQAVLPRAVTAQGRLSVQAATGCSIIGAVATVAVIWTVLTWRVIHPLLVMVDFAKRLGRSDDLESQLDFDRTDEIGTLADAFDEMVIGLAESRRRVLESAHQAGMAEIASEVLHNVGNAVNSTYCSVEVLHENLEKSKASGLQKAAELLAEQAPRAHEFFSSDPRGPKLIDYIGKLSDALLDEKSANLAELERIRMTVCHIRDAIAAQQDIARRSEFRQSTSIRKLVDDVLELQHEQLRSAGVQVTCRIDIAQNVSVNDSKLTQVLVNLIRNAVQALQGVDPHRRQLEIRASLVEDGSLVMEIIDNGCGFDEAVRARLFTHGFTTKPEGNGLGLHYCANAIREAGGSITAQSDGPGCGAAFRLTLPNVTTDKLKRPDPLDRATESHTSNL